MLWIRMHPVWLTKPSDSCALSLPVAAASAPCVQQLCFAYVLHTGTGGDHSETRHFPCRVPTWPMHLTFHTTMLHVAPISLHEAPIGIVLTYPNTNPCVATWQPAETVSLMIACGQQHHLIFHYTACGRCGLPSVLHTHVDPYAPGVAFLN